MAEQPSGSELAVAGFFVFRTPLLPVESYQAWGEGLKSPDVDSGDPEGLARAVAADRERLRSQLMEQLERLEIREALHVASPALLEAVERWRNERDGKKAERIERALSRYMTRMAMRATPFGLFSGCSVGVVRSEAPTRIRLGPLASYRRHTRLDMDYLFTVCERLAARPEVRRALLHRPNSSLYPAAGRLHYAESGQAGESRTYRLIALDDNPFIRATLERASAGAFPEDLASALVAMDPDGDISLDEALPFIEELIDGQVLVPDLSPQVTGPGAILDLCSTLRRAGSAAAETLDQAARRLAALDGQGVGNEPEVYRELIRDLESGLGVEVNPSRFVQVDMLKPAHEATLGGAVVQSLVRGIEILHRLSPRPKDPFESFRAAFETRFGDRRHVPLMEVLDEETGIGFHLPGQEPAEGAPLLQGLAFPSAPQETAGWGARERYLHRLIQEAAARGERRIDLRPEDLESLANPEPAPLPDAFHVIAQIAASSPDELLKERNGRYQVRIVSASGPSGARLLGRFCHLDGDILNGVRAHIADEESLRPEAVFAEVVHLPEGRIGNVLARPALRPYEIPFLGRPSVEPELRIPLSDLRISIVSGRVVLTSERLDREVIPRLTTAHNFVSRTLGVYRFLGALQAQGTVGSLFWNWGPLESLPFLPRVTAGRLVLERARWNIPATEIRPLERLQGAGLLREVRGWRERRGLPRHVVLAVLDNELPLDLENIVNVESLLDEAQDRSWVVLHELFPGPEDTWLEGPEGRFLHELVVPFIDRSRKDAIRGPRKAAPSVRVRRDFPPGSEWLYAKLYTGTATADTVLRDAVAPLVRSSLASGDADAWFFIRYGDPEWHLRVRLHGDPEALQGGVLPVLQREASALLDRHLIWRFQLDTYQREVSRYGGPEAIAAVEWLFWSDSEAVLGIVEALQDEQAAGERWRLAVRGIDLLLSDLGFDLAGKTRVVETMREGYTREFRADLRLKKQLGARQRELWEEVERLIRPGWDDQEPLAAGFELLAERSRLSTPALAEIAQLNGSGRLLVSREELALSLVHMHVNRLLRAEGRAHELVLSEMLFRCYTAQARRGADGAWRYHRDAFNLDES